MATATRVSAAPTRSRRPRATRNAVSGPASHDESGDEVVDRVAGDVVPNADIECGQGHGSVDGPSRDSRTDLPVSKLRDASLTR
jgi:hypothetical protein